MSLRLDGETDRDEASRLVIEAYRQGALKRMLKQLDEPGQTPA